MQYQPPNARSNMTSNVGFSVVFQGLWVKRCQ